MQTKRSSRHQHTLNYRNYLKNYSRQGDVGFYYPWRRLLYTDYPYGGRPKVI
jgi:hypothetical protein